MLIVMIRALVLYLVVIVSVRLMGKRQIGELQPSELVVTILLSNIATLPIEDISTPMVMGVVPILTLVCIDVLFSYLSMHFGSVRKAVCGSAKIIISNGEVDVKTLKELRLTPDDLMAALRTGGVFDISDVQSAVVETTGSISVCTKNSASPPAAKDLELAIGDEDPPVMVVSGGEVSQAALRSIGRDEKWLRSVAKAQGAEVSNIYIMAADRQGKYTIVKDIKDDKGKAQK